MGLSINIETHRGDDDYFIAQVYEPDSSTIGSYSIRDITDDSLFFAVKSDETDDSDDYEFSKTSTVSTEINKTDATNGKYKVVWDAGDTVDLSIDTYFYAVELTDSSGNKKTILEGQFIVKSDVVRE